MAYIDLKRSTLICRIDRAAGESKRGRLSSKQILRAIGREELEEQMDNSKEPSEQIKRNLGVIPSE